jgi:hypothetical protein
MALDMTVPGRHRQRPKARLQKELVGQFGVGALISEYWRPLLPTTTTMPPQVPSPEQPSRMVKTEQLEEGPGTE